jgi:hypothetical protein
MDTHTTMVFAMTKVLNTVARRVESFCQLAERGVRSMSVILYPGDFRQHPRWLIRALHRPYRRRATCPLSSSSWKTHPTSCRVNKNHAIEYTQPGRHVGHTPVFYNNDLAVHSHVQLIITTHICHHYNVRITAGRRVSPFAAELFVATHDI